MLIIPDHIEYPYTDEYGDLWLDSTGMLIGNGGSCFICGGSTLRLDIDYAAYFCNSEECRETVEEELLSFDDVWTDGTGTTFVNVHSPANCKAPCPIHSPSDHLMRDWPMLMRTDSFSYGLIERTCVHGIGHPDPDSVVYFASMGKTSYGVHGCDGCCSGRFDELNG